MKRLWMLKPSTKLCTDFYVFDTETAHKKKDGYLYWCLKARPSNFIFGVIYGYNYIKVIHSVKEFKRTLLDSRFKGKKMFAHNAQYDLNTIYGNIFDFDEKAIFNGKFISATNGICTFADSMNVFVGLSVASIGKMMGNEKQTLGGNGYRSKKVGHKEINYCVRDCEIVWDALFSVFEFAGDIKITQASLSMTYFRRYHQNFHIDHNANTEFFFESYYGGRCEAFKLGRTHAAVIDVNSMYPFVMKSLQFPNPKNLKHEINFPVKKFDNLLKWYEGCVAADIDHKDTKFGYLPVKRNGKLIFPIGKFSGCWNFNEIRFAVKSGIVKIRKIHHVVYAERMQSPFVDFINVLQEKKFRAKLEGNKFEEDRAKRFSNSLYGKLAQRIDEESIYIHDMTKEWDTIRDYQRKGMFIRLQPFSAKRNDCFLFVTNIKQMSISYCIPSFASYITSEARVILLKKMIAMKENKVVYCDTDSIFFEYALKPIDTSDELGGWKIENKVITEIKGLKNYRYVAAGGSPVWRIKGVPVIKGNIVTIFSGETEKVFPACEQINENTFKYWNLVKNKEALKRGIEPGILIERTKVIKNTYGKRLIFQDGETKPIKLCLT